MDWSTEAQNLKYSITVQPKLPKGGNRNQSSINPIDPIHHQSSSVIIIIISHQSSFIHPSIDPSIIHVSIDPSIAWSSIHPLSTSPSIIYPECSSVIIIMHSSSSIIIDHRSSSVNHQSNQSSHRSSQSSQSFNAFDPSINQSSQSMNWVRIRDGAVPLQWFHQFGTEELVKGEFRERPWKTQVWGHYSAKGYLGGHREGLRITECTGGQYNLWRQELDNRRNLGNTPGGPGGKNRRGGTKKRDLRKNHNEEGKHGR